MKDRLVRRGIPAAQIQIAENWANGAAIQPQPRPGDMGELVLLYSGNLGLAPDIDTLCGAMLALRHEPFRFLFVGGGNKRKIVSGFAQEHGIDRVEMRPYVSRDRLSEGLAAGDIGVVTQDDVCLGTVVPSKVYGIMAAGRPLLFIGPGSATPAHVIRRHGCGWHVPVGDVAGLTALLRHLSANHHEVTEAGDRARAALVEHYDLPLGIGRIARILEGAPNPVFSVPLPAPGDSTLPHRAQQISTTR